MHIEKLSVKDREVTVRLSADEIVKLCNSLHYAPEKQQNDIYHKLYSDLLLVYDSSIYGRYDFHLFHTISFSIFKLNILPIHSFTRSCVVPG